MTDQSHASQPDSPGEFTAFTLGALLGMAMGAVLALWFAPRSGQQTRHELRTQAEQARERLDGPPTERLMAQAKTAAQVYRETPDRQ
ncbi:MAG: YtxH domain-containing protein [Aggregatilineales bacterium]